MGKINVFTGMVTGMVGTVTMSSWKGKPYMKGNNKKSDKPPSDKQLINQARMGLVSKFLYALGMPELLEKTFANFAIGKTGVNAALSYNIKNCITGNYPEFAIDYSRVLLSRGDIPSAIDASVEAIGGGTVQFRWTNRRGTSPAGPEDKCIGLIYSPEVKEARYSNDKKFREMRIVSEETRESGSATLPLNVMLGKPVETWLIFLSSNGRDVADSVYTGQVVIV